MDENTCEVVDTLENVPESALEELSNGKGDEEE